MSVFDVHNRNSSFLGIPLFYPFTLVRSAAVDGEMVSSELTRSYAGLEHMGTSETGNSESFEQLAANQIVGAATAVRNLIIALCSKGLLMIMYYLHSMGS